MKQMCKSLGLCVLMVNTVVNGLSRAQLRSLIERPDEPWARIIRPGCEHNYRLMEAWAGVDLTGFNLHYVLSELHNVTLNDCAAACGCEDNCKAMVYKNLDRDGETHCSLKSHVDVSQIARTSRVFTGIKCLYTGIMDLDSTLGAPDTHMPAVVGNEDFCLVEDKIETTIEPEVITSLAPCVLNNCSDTETCVENVDSFECVPNDATVGLSVSTGFFGLTTFGLLGFVLSKLGVQLPPALTPNPANSAPKNSQTTTGPVPRSGSSVVKTGASEISARIGSVTNIQETISSVKPKILSNKAFDKVIDFSKNIFSKKSTAGGKNAKALGKKSPMKMCQQVCGELKIVGSPLACESVAREEAVSHTVAINDDHLNDAVNINNDAVNIRLDI